MKTIITGIKKVLLCALFGVVFAVLGRSQSPIVSDPALLAEQEVSNAVMIEQSIEDLVNSLKQIGILSGEAATMTEIRDWYNQMFGEGSAYRAIRTVLDDLGVLKSLTKCLNFQLEYTGKTLKTLANWEEEGFDPMCIDAVLVNIASSLRTTTAIVNRLKKLMDDTGISKEEKIKEAEEAEREILNNVDKSVSASLTTMAYSVGKKGLVGFYASTGTPVGDGDSDDGDLDDDLSAHADGSVSYEDVLTGEDGQVVSKWKADVWTFVGMLLGLLGLLSLIGAYVRYVSDSYGSDGTRALLRVGVGLLAGAILIVVLKSVVG